MDTNHPLLPTFPGAWGNALGVASQRPSWLWEGYLADGNITLLTSQWKSGKTTLVAALLSRLREGGRLAGLPVAPGKAIVVSEESPEQWHLRHERFDMSQAYFLCRPFCGKPRPEEWTALLDHIARLEAVHGFRLLVVDTLAGFLPGRNEASAAAMIEALAPLHRLTALGMAILLLHHPRKGEPAPGQAARGSGALAGFVDIILEMNACSPGDAGDRRRRVLAFSRYERTLPECVIELNREGTDYLTHGNFQEDEFARHWDCLHMVLEDAPAPQTRQQLLDAWPADFPRPDYTTLARWLQRASALGLVVQTGTGRRNDPFRVCLAGRTERPRPDDDPVLQIQRMLEESRRQVLEDLQRAQAS